MNCKDCTHYDVCIESGRVILEFYGEDDAINFCSYFKDASKFIELPCSIGDPYFTIERFCTEGGYHEEKREVRPSDCEYCCEECDKEFRIVERKFYNVIDILQKEKYIGKTVFLTREEAEKKLGELNGK